MSSNKENRIIALFLMLFCIFTYFYIIPRYIMVWGKQTTPTLSPTFFPKFCVILIAILAFFLLIISGRKTKEERKKPMLGKKEKIRIILTMLAVFAYIYLIGLIGYWIMTPIFLGTIMIFFGVRDWRTVAFVTLLSVVGIYIFFQKFLKILLPLGSFFE